MTIRTRLNLWYTLVLCGVATVVIGGLVTATVLTLFVLPAIAKLIYRKAR